MYIGEQVGMELGSEEGGALETWRGGTGLSKAVLLEDGGWIQKV